MSQVNISFLGDIALNDDYIKLYNENKNPFKDIGERLHKKDYVIGNLEAMCEGRSENVLKKPRIKTNLETLNFLNNININVITLAHNHIYDNLEDGYDNTCQFLDENNILYFGAGDCEANATKPLFINKDGIKLCFLNYLTKDTNPKLPNEAKIKINFYDKDQIEKDIKTYKDQVDHVVLMFHWGGRHENGYYPDQYQMNDSKFFIDCGADLIVGGHPHVFQPYEVYRGKYIFYSLGNFCFSDAYKFDYQINQERATKSIILDIKFLKNEYKVNMVPIRNKQSYIVIDYNLQSEFSKRQVLFKMIKKNSFLWKLYHYYHSYIYHVYYYFFGNNRKFLTQFKKIKFEKIKYYFLRK